MPTGGGLAMALPERLTVNRKLSLHLNEARFGRSYT